MVRTYKPTQTSILLVFTALLFLLSCRDGSRGATDRLHRSTVVALESSGKSIALNVEVAIDPWELSRGLMYRKTFPKNGGMLFVFPRTEEHTFWMKNTWIPLDMIFLDENAVIIGILENREPLSLVPLTIGKPSRYVLEVNGGFCRQYGVKVGTRAKIQPFSP